MRTLIPDRILLSIFAHVGIGAFNMTLLYAPASILNYYAFLLAAGRSLTIWPCSISRI